MRKTIWNEPSKRTGKPCIRWYDPVTGKAKRHPCENAKEAKKFMAETILMLENWKPGKTTTVIPPLTVLGSHLKDKAPEWRPHTVATRKREVEFFLTRPSIMTMVDITADEIRKWVSEMQTKSRSISTISLRLRELKSFLSWCVLNGYLEANPFLGKDGITIPASEEVGRRFTLDELKRLSNGCPDWFRPYFVFCFATGARQGDMLRMEWEDLDLEEGEWRIPKHKAKNRRARTVPLTDEAQATLHALRGPRNVSGLLGLVFAGWSPRRVQHGWVAAIKASGLKGRARPHDLRHTFASNFRGRWASLKAICGWTTDVMAGRYTHTVVDELREDINKFGVNLGWFGAKQGKNRA